MLYIIFVQRFEPQGWRCTSFLLYQVLLPLRGVKPASVLRLFHSTLCQLNHHLRLLQLFLLGLLLLWVTDNCGNCGCIREREKKKKKMKKKKKKRKYKLILTSSRIIHLRKGWVTSLT